MVELIEHLTRQIQADSQKPFLTAISLMTPYGYGESSRYYQPDAGEPEGHQIHRLMQSLRCLLRRAQAIWLESSNLSNPMERRSAGQYPERQG